MDSSLRRVTVLGIFWILLFSSCSFKEKKIDEGIIISEKVHVLSSTALIATKLGEVKKGDQLDILGTTSVNGIDYVKVSFPPQSKETKTGWIESRHIISQKILSQCEKLSETAVSVPAQIIGKLKEQSRLRLEPNRNSEVVTLLKSGATFDIIKRVRTILAPNENLDESTKSGSPSQPRFDDWYLVRFSEDSIIPAGWFYGGAVDIVMPSAISGLIGPGRHAVACVSFGEVLDKDGTIQKNYIILDKQDFNRDDLIDFDRVYIVAWDVDTNGYGSIYIESSLRGIYPILYNHESSTTHFSIPLLDKGNQPITTKYEISPDIKTDKLHVVRISDGLTHSVPQPNHKK